MNFKNVAKDTTSTSAAMAGKNKLDVNDIIHAYSDGCTINYFDLINGKDGQYAVLNIAEDESIFFFGGSVLTSLVKAWVDSFDGTVSECAEALKASGGVKVILNHAKSQSGRNYVAVNVID